MKQVLIDYEKQSIYHQGYNSTLDLVHPNEKTQQQLNDVLLHQLHEKPKSEFFHAVVGHSGQRVLGQEVGQSADRKKSQNHHWHQPQRKFVFSEAFVQQRLKKGRDHGLCEGRNQGGPDGQSPNPFVAAKVGFESLKSFSDAGGRA